ncbi:cell envelope integrity protein TolA [Thermaurantimonas aggregans]|uniref:cell envelope integrity protein TolA n=1 Tax=Thermaurantimonas aggregans TaxID=2173829 RepID=UPI0023F1D4F8|nr:cell envelope integrity protein TolA [Thermaurantimonas aggregans]MCX8149496.1 hypothetical protein [Thermaurantimonas aggregans]
MDWPKTKEEKNALALTILINLVLFIIFLFFGLTYFDPKPEEGIAIQFGFNADAGGPQNITDTQQPQPSQTTPASSNTSKTEFTSPTQDVEDAPAINQNKNPKTTQKPQDIKKPENQQPQEDKPQIDQRLQNILNNPNRGAGGQSGSGSQAGTQGSPTGTNESGNSGGGGSGAGSSGTGYFLGGRTAQVKPKPDYNCQEFGRVVVRIKVDQNGNVIEAIPGVSFQNFSTNVFSECLNQRARDAALRTKWSADQDAPEEQIGYIIYEFRKN